MRVLAKKLELQKKCIKDFLFYRLISKCPTNVILVLLVGYLRASAMVSGNRLPRVSGKKTAKDPATVGRVLTIKKKSFQHGLIMSVSFIFYQLPQHP